jgi:hypothetical protein
MGTAGSSCGARDPPPDVEETTLVFSSSQREPDYNDASAWHCCFNVDKGNNIAAWVPKLYHAGSDSPPRPFESKQDTATCDVFYVHDTTVLRGLGNASLDEKPGVAGYPDSGEDVRTKASAFNACAAVYAPKYRQARLSNLHMMEGSVLEEPFGSVPSYLEVSAVRARLISSYV